MNYYSRESSRPAKILSSSARVVSCGRGAALRLSQVDIQKIREVVAAEFGPQSVVILFGSRVDDSARGGDVDLMITVDGRPANLPFATSLLAARLTRVLGGRAVDVIVRTADSGRQPIHDIAERTGVRI